MIYFCDLERKSGEDLGQGAIWGMESEDLDCTLVAWSKGEGVAPHVNDEVDVLMVVMEGTVHVELPEEDRRLSEGQLLLIPKGILRRIESHSDRVVYINVHKRRRPMTLSGMESYPRRANE